MAAEPLNDKELALVRGEWGHLTPTYPDLFADEETAITRLLATIEERDRRLAAAEKVVREADERHEQDCGCRGIACELGSALAEYDAASRTTGDADE